MNSNDVKTEFFKTPTEDYKPLNIKYEPDEEDGGDDDYDLDPLEPECQVGNTYRSIYFVKMYYGL